MPDITMCRGNGCELKDNCYRYKATPNDFRQSWFFKPPFTGSSCDYFWKNNLPNTVINNKIYKLNTVQKLLIKLKIIKDPNMNIELYRINSDYYYFDEDTKTEGVMYVEEHEHMGKKYTKVVGYDVYDVITEKVDAYINKYPKILNNLNEI